MPEYTKKPTINAVPTSNKPNKEEFLIPILFEIIATGLKTKDEKDKVSMSYHLFFKNIRNNIFSIFENKFKRQ